MSVDGEILKCEAELRQTQLTGDVAMLDRLIGEALLFTSFDGTVASKSEDLAMHQSGRLRITKMDPSDRHMLHLGSASVVSVRMNADAILDGAPIAATMRYTRIWQRRPEGWRLVAGPMSIVPA